MCLMEKLTFQEEEIMLIIWQVKEGVIKDFLNCMEEPRPPYTTVASIVKNLEKKGYVYRKEDPADRRNKLVFLTPEGEEFKDQIRPILDQVYVYAEKIIGIESIETMLSELKGVCDVLENV